MTFYGALAVIFACSTWFMVVAVGQPARRAAATRAMAMAERSLRQHMQLTEALIQAGADRSGRMAELLAQGKAAADDLAAAHKQLR